MQADGQSKARRTRVLFSDLLNLPRGKYVPTSVAAKGSIGFARGVFATTFDRDLIAVPGTGVHEGLPDMQLKLDPERRPGWQPGTEIALGTSMRTMPPSRFVPARP